jgi:hypothetical protein
MVSPLLEDESIGLLSPIRRRSITVVALKLSSGVNHILDLHVLGTEKPQMSNRRSSDFLHSISAKSLFFVCLQVCSAFEFYALIDVLFVLLVCQPEKIVIPSFCCRT